MNRLTAALRCAAEDLDGSGLRWALVGGFAVSARVEPRFTRDVDVAVMVDGDTQAEQLVRTLITGGYSVFSSLEHDSGRLATVRMTREFDGVDVVVDLLFASSGIEPEVAQGAETLEVAPGLHLPVAAVGHLIALRSSRATTRRGRRIWPTFVPCSLSLARQTSPWPALRSN